METPTAAFIGLEALLVLLTLVVVIITSLNELNQQCVFANPTEVRDCALGSEATPSPEVPPDEPFASEVAMFASTAEETPRRLRLKGAQRLNALAVLSVYQTLVFVPVIAAAAVVFWAIGRLAVPPEVAAEWIYGDGQGRRGPELAARSFLAEPWTRVAIPIDVLAAVPVGDGAVESNAAGRVL